MCYCLCTLSQFISCFFHHYNIKMFTNTTHQFMTAQMRIQFNSLQKLYYFASIHVYIQQYALRIYVSNMHKYSSVQCTQTAYIRLMYASWLIFLPS